MFFCTPMMVILGVGLLDVGVRVAVGVVVKVAVLVGVSVGRGVSVGCGVSLGSGVKVGSGLAVGGSGVFVSWVGISAATVKAASVRTAFTVNARSGVGMAGDSVGKPQAVNRTRILTIVRNFIFNIIFTLKIFAAFWLTQAGNVHAI